MEINLTFRTTPEKRDIQRIMEIVESTGFFYDHEVEIAVELVTERLAHGESTGYHFIFAVVDGITSAYSCLVRFPCLKHVLTFTGSLPIMIFAEKVSEKNYWRRPAIKPGAWAAKFL
jgi:hypothetical protein